MFHALRPIVAILAVMTALTTAALAAPPVVVTSIKPVHALASAVMQGVGEPHLVVDGAASPHDFSLKPSSADALQRAGLVFWIGPGMENFLTDAIETLASDARVVSLAEAEGVLLLDQREGGAFEAHDHDHEEHEHEEEHDHEDDEHAHDEDHDHAHGEADMHLWLDPQNAIAMVRAMEGALSGLDPQNAAEYARNAGETISALEALIEEVRAELAPVADRPFIVFHDAYHYFENRFGLAAAGAITVSPEAIPGAQRLAEIRARIASLGAVCVFAEPQFEPRLVNTVTEGTDARSGVLDPLGADLENGPGLYFRLIRNLAANVRDCLSG